MRVISFDGGPSALITLRVLRELEARYPGFVDRAQMFSGTSTGAFVSLYLAHALSARHREGNKQPGCLDIIDGCIAFNERMTRQFKVKAINIARLISGLYPMYDGEAIREVLEETFGDAKLCELERMVVIEAFDSTVWRKATYHQFPPHADYVTTIVDAALASSAFPVLMPIYRSGNNLGGHKNDLMMDGALSNNSTAMTALSDALGYFAYQDGHDAEADGLSEARYLSRISILSLGCTPQSPKWFERCAEMNSSLGTFLESLWKKPHRRPMREMNYGWIWLLLHNFRAAMAYIEGGAQSDARYASELLGPTRFFRFRPPLNSIDFVMNLLGDPDALIEQTRDVARVCWKESLEAYHLQQRMPPEQRQPWSNLISWAESYWMGAPPPMG
ncbi:patatin-like phospholipase family protein [Stigmatella sp. ncwal1]|uniref:Patatin-like phospholipase family protein n=1 Tax=Stigmatella ashevillensis TaxID=2995309 RepID=A0ABT5DHN5_9BACT|nr:patatin-like phospholipase family protein [Stigmatella ashevillena]MDC0711871.1 patatin-like phospholipase family protein [Stigmatella ashevillena]